MKLTFDIHLWLVLFSPGHPASGRVGVLVKEKKKHTERYNRNMPVNMGIRGISGSWAEPRREPLCVFEELDNI